jgi:hypothetical protein
MTTSDLLLVSKYDGEFGTFFFPKQTLRTNTFLALHWSFFLVTTVRQFQEEEEGKKKHSSSSHTAIECGFFLVVVVVVVVGLGS